MDPILKCHLTKRLPSQMAPPYRVDHVGSLIRPQSLIDARRTLRTSFDHTSSGTPEQQVSLKALTSRCIHDVVDAQLQHGVTTITNGEFDRTVFWDDFYESLSGFEKSYMPFSEGKWRPGFFINEAFKTFGLKGRLGKVAVSRIKRERSAFMEGWIALKDSLPEKMIRDAKITIIAPTWWLEMLEKPYTATSGYKNDREYLLDIATAMHEEILELYAAGLRNVQIDDPFLSALYTESWEPVLRSNGMKIEHLLDDFIACHNHLLKDLPSDLNVSLHMCRGNIPGYPTLVGGYNMLLQRLFLESSYKLFLLEWDEPEHGDFSPLIHLPRDKAVLLGLVSTKSAVMEDPEYLKGRILEAANVISKAQGRGQSDVLDDNLGLTTQCGFGTAMDQKGINVTEEAQWEKMRLMQRVAEEMWLGWKEGLGHGSEAKL